MHRNESIGLVLGHSINDSLDVALRYFINGNIRVTLGHFIFGALAGAMVMWVRYALKARATRVRSAAEARAVRLRSAAEAQAAATKAEQERVYKAAWSIKNPNNQIRFLEKTNLYSCKPINKEAYASVFMVLERFLASLQPKYRLLAEVSMGSFLRTSGTASPRLQDHAFRSFNSKRVDFLIIDPYGEPKLAIEYHGSGHFLSDRVSVEQRDAVKRLALQRAGVPLLEFGRNSSKTEIENKVFYWLKTQQDS